MGDSHLGGGGGTFPGGFLLSSIFTESDYYRYKIESLVWMNCTVLTFLLNFYIRLKLWFECCDLLARIFRCLDGFSS